MWITFLAPSGKMHHVLNKGRQFRIRPYAIGQTKIHNLRQFFDYLHRTSVKFFRRNHLFTVTGKNHRFSFSKF